MALAGGASIAIPQTRGYHYQEGMIFSPDGHCRAFDKHASGTVPGNGVGIVVLKRLSDALSDRDHIYAVIRGYGINNDGMDKMNYSAPSVVGQMNVIITALETAGIDPATISYIEAHGTGTLIGDPIETRALTDAFRLYTKKTQYCALGSVKNNIGHLFEAAGIAGLIKTVLALEKRTIPSCIHVQEVNPNIDLKNSPFFITEKTHPWDTQSLPRRAGVSSFGIGGTNAHVVLEETPQNPSSSVHNSTYLLPFSAKSAEALEKMIFHFQQWIESNPTKSLADAAYTLQIGRQEFAYRYACIGNSWEEVLSNLKQYNSSKITKVSHFQSSIVETATSVSLEELRQIWLAGGRISWQNLYQQENPQRISLPTYPFEKKHYWIDAPFPAALEGQKKSAPKTREEIEDYLLAIWKELLSVQINSLKDNFFQIGGDSMLVVQLLSQIETVFGVSLGLQTLLEAPTIAQLTAILVEKLRLLTTVEPLLIKLKSGNSSPSLFLIHPIEGHVLGYRNLVEQLHYEGPIYGIQASHTPLHTIETIAHEYVQAIRALQPEGPYNLLGASFGGILAYEMAYQLQNDYGQQIPLLCLVDAPCPSSVPFNGDSELFMVEFLLALIKGDAAPSKAAIHSLSHKERIAQLMTSLGLEALSLQKQQEIFAQIRRHWSALQTYHPKNYKGDLLFFEAQDRFSRMNETSLGLTWKSLVSNPISVYEISGSHTTLLKNTQLAKALNRYFSSLKSEL
jgi:thioesterase domain-containing protein/acyl carrier protein